MVTAVESNEDVATSKPETHLGRLGLGLVSAESNVATAAFESKWSGEYRVARCGQVVGRLVHGNERSS